MKLPLRWLKEFTPVEGPPEKLAARFLTFGFPAEVVGPGLLEVEVTYNRGDCLSILGLAREYAASKGLSLELPPQASLEPGRNQLWLRLDQDLFERYLAAEVELRSVTVPKFVTERLKLMGSRSVHPVVDVTNYVMWETGVPLHAFDLDRIMPEMELRLSTLDESISLLDGKTYRLPAGSLVFARGTELLDLVGIMGGDLSAVTAGTRRIWLQAGTFDRDRIYQTSTSLRLSTDAAFRFSRGVDSEIVPFALGRAGQLLGLKQLSTFAAGRPPTPLVIPLNVRRLSQVLGLKISEETIREKLRLLRFTIESERGSAERRTLLVSVPNFRRADITIEEDLFEEVLRLSGYKKLLPRVLPRALPKLPERSQLEAMVAPSRPSLSYELKRNLRVRLAGLGFSEILSSTFVSGSEIEAAGLLVHRAIKLLRPASPEAAFVRPSLVIGLAKAVAENPWAGSIKLFEIGRVGEIEGETERLGLALSGDGRGELRSLVGLSGLHLLPTDHPLSRLLKLRRTVTIAELMTERLPAVLLEPGPRLSFPLSVSRPLSSFPPAVRDLSIIIRANISDEELFRPSASSVPELALVELFDRYDRPEFGPQRESRAYHLVFDHRERTLASAEVDRAMNRIIKKLTEKFQAVVR